jgi:hypothetical protein
LASLFGDASLASFVSFFDSLFVSALGSEIDSLLLSDFVADVPDFSELFSGDVLLSPLSLGAAPRESVLYHPDPLNTIAGVVISLRGRSPQLGHFSTGPSLYERTAEKEWPHASQ